MTVMTPGNDEPPPNKRKKIRVAMRRNRAKPPRVSDWTRQARETDGLEVDSVKRETVTSKGEQSRRRTIIVQDTSTHEGKLRGIVVSMHGLVACVDHQGQIVSCSVPRVLRTREIKERHPVAVGDWVQFRLEKPTGNPEPQGVLEKVEPRHGQLRRRSDDRIQTIVANVDQVLIVTSANDPPPKANLIDRYIVSAHVGEIAPLLCVNKIDLDVEDAAAEIADRYRSLGYVALCVSALSGVGIDLLKGALKDKSTVVAGQSGVGKSSLLNAVQPGLGLKVGEVTRDTQKGRHTTTAASLIRLDFGGFVVDTPGIRAFELADIDRRELEAYFVEIAERVAECRFPGCSHIHEMDCAIRLAVDSGAIHPERYESYVRLFEEGAGDSRSPNR